MKVTAKEFQSLAGLTQPNTSAVLNFLVRIGLATVSKERVNGRISSVYTLADSIRLQKVTNA